jgi:hypothetical protein
MRENDLIDTLRAVAPEDLRFIKGEVCDSHGRRSPEFDVVVSYRSDAIRLFNSPANQVVPVETVLAVMEIKSVLSKDSIVKLDSDIKSLNSFERYYQPTSSYQYVGDITGNKEYAAFPGRPITPAQHLYGVTRVIGSLFAFEAPKMETVKQWLAEAQIQPNFALICVLGDFIAVRNIETSSWEVVKAGEDSFGAYAQSLLKGLTEGSREEYVRCDSGRYLNLTR